MGSGVVVSAMATRSSKPTGRSGGGDCEAVLVFEAVWESVVCARAADAGGVAVLVAAVQVDGSRLGD